MPQRPPHRRRRSISFTPKQLALAVFLVGFFLFIVMFLGRANQVA